MKPELAIAEGTCRPPPAHAGTPVGEWGSAGPQHPPTRNGTKIAVCDLAFLGGEATRSPGGDRCNASHPLPPQRLKARVPLFLSCLGTRWQGGETAAPLEVGELTPGGRENPKLKTPQLLILLSDA